MDRIQWYAIVGAFLAGASNANALTGRVVELGTNKPVEGAFIAVTWNGHAWNPVQAASTCYHVEIRVTDVEGRFHVPDFTGNWNPLIRDRERSVSVYAPGKAVVEAKDDDTLFKVAQRTGTRQEQFAAVTMASTSSCLEATDKRLLPMWKAYHQDLARLAVTRAQQLKALDVQTFVDQIELGEEQAAKNYAARYEALMKDQKGADK